MRWSRAVVMFAAFALVAAVSADAGPRGSPSGTLVWSTEHSLITETVRAVGLDAKSRVLAGGAGPAPSPDGGRIAFASGSNAVAMNADGSGRVSLGLGSVTGWSPDSTRLLLYVQKGNGESGGDFWVENADGSGRTHVGFGRDAEWSPDGKTIAFQHADGVAVVNADGTGLRVVGPDGFVPSWSPDGKRIAYACCLSDVLSVQLLVTDTAAGQPVVLGDIGGAAVGPPAWSPDGSRVALNTDFDAGPGEDLGRALLVARIADRTQRLIKTGVKVYDPVWSPTGAWIAFGEDRHEQHTSETPPPEIGVVHPDGTGLHEVAVGQDAAWAPDGSLIAFDSAAGIGVVQPNGNGARTLAGPPSPGSVVGPVWLPKSKTVLYTASEGAVAAGIFTSNVQGARARRLSRGAGDIEPAWSPDGRRIAFAHEVNPQEDVSGPLYVMSADGSGRRLIQRGSFDGEPAWSPDGKSIAYENFDGIAVVGSHGGRARQLTSNEENAPDWSPDGKWIVFTDRGVVRLRPSGRGRTPLDGGPACNPAWSPNGKQIAFERASDCGIFRKSRLFLMRSDGKNVHELAATTVGDPQWSPDGRWIIGNNGILVRVADGAVTTLSRLKALEAVSIHWRPQRARG
jgi:Tol biopolymer transport system component